MKKFFFDIETLPAEGKDQDTLKYLYEKKKKEDFSFEDFLAQTSFDGAFGRICCIAYAIDDGEVECLSGPEDERAMLKKFWDIVSGVQLFVGHNVRDFDLPFILQRSIMLGVKPSWSIYQEAGKKPWEMTQYLDFARYKNSPIFDTMWEWSRWVDRWSNKGLEHLALALGIPTPKDGIDGSQVAKFYEDGKLEEICDYCKRDVDVVREIYKRMTFE